MFEALHYIGRREDLEVLCLKCGKFRENAYVIRDCARGDHLVIDPGDGFYDNYIKQFGGTEYLKGILLTHAHFDHVGSAKLLSSSSGVPVTLHPDDFKLLRKAPLYSLMVQKNRIEIPADVNFIYPGGNVEVGGFGLTVIPTPGHTAGSISTVVGQFAFTGDTLFYKAIGPTNYLESDYSQLIMSVDELLKSLSDGICILPGHGRPWESGSAKNWWKQCSKSPRQLNIS